MTLNEIKTKILNGATFSKDSTFYKSVVERLNDDIRLLNTCYSAEEVMDKNRDIENCKVGKKEIVISFKNGFILRIPIDIPIDGRKYSLSLRLKIEKKTPFSLYFYVGEKWDDKKFRFLVNGNKYETKLDEVPYLRNYLSLNSSNLKSGLTRDIKTRRKVLVS